MAWTYLKRDKDGEIVYGSPDLPGRQTAYLAFDICRGAVVIGYTERGGSHSFLSPNVDDDCCIVAFAPLSETTDPDIETIQRLASWDGKPQYDCGAPFKLFRDAR